MSGNEKPQMFGAHRDSKHRHSPKSNEARPLCYEETYRCPICRHGYIAELTLMDAFSCDFCRHIFTANLSTQTVQVVDSAQPMSWRWTGQGWRTAYHADVDLTVLLWIMGAVLLLIPGGMVSLAAYVFPPLPDSQGAWLPVAWVAATFLLHSMLVVWLLAEHYQLPLYVASRVRLQRWFESRV